MVTQELPVRQYSQASKKEPNGTRNLDNRLLRSVARFPVAATCSHFDLLAAYSTAVYTQGWLKSYDFLKLAARLDGNVKRGNLNGTPHQGPT